MGLMRAMGRASPTDSVLMPARTPGPRPGETRLNRHLLSLAACLLLAIPTPRARLFAEDVMDLDLEALLEIQLSAMSITGIHHVHEKGEWMVGYSTMRMGMSGNRDGTARMSPADLFGQGFMVAPTSMDMEMHMVGLMYAPVDRWTLMLMLPYRRLSMDHITGMGTRFTTRSEGLGDISLTALYSLLHRGGRRLVLNVGVTVPTGSIDEVDNTPMGRVRLPYPMQIGSGTYDLQPGLTYLDQREHWSWGAHGTATVRAGENDNDYRLGNRVELTAWGARRFTPWLSSSVRLAAGTWHDIHGADPLLMPAMVPTADPGLRGGRRLDLLLGVNFFATSGRLEGNRLAVEAGVPVYQDLDGPQLETDWRLSTSWQWTFGR